MTDTGMLDRSLQSLTIGLPKGQSYRKTQQQLEGLQEFEDQFKIAISGRGEEFPAWQEVHVNFNITFVDATGQRDAPFDQPHFTYGVYISDGGPVGVLACVTRWDVNRRNEITGCMLGIGAVATDHARTFRGELHARFQGYGAPVEAYGDETQYDQD
jgi:hypothetical protein